MDPNETLEQLRRYAADDTGEDWLDFGPELFQALDSWLSDGGFLPADWQQATRDNPCPFTFAHTRHWCGYKTCRDS